MGRGEEKPRSMRSGSITAQAAPAPLPASTSTNTGPSSKPFEAAKRASLSPASRPTA